MTYSGKMRIAVVGAGFMGQLHARCVSESALADLAGIVEPVEALGEQVSGLFGVSHIRSIADALRRDDIDGFIVAVPDRAHQATIPILEHGKPVLLEKPMAHDLDTAKRIAGAARAGNARLMVAHILRFDPRYVQAAQKVRSGEIGDPVHASSGRLTLRDVGLKMNGSSSVCFYLGVHDVDLLQWLTGRNIEAVYARATGRLMASKGVDSEDAIFAVCEMEGDMVGTLHCGWSLPSEMPTGIWSRSEVVGTEGVVEVDVRDHGLRVMAPQGWHLPDGLHWPEVNDRLTGDIRDEVEHFIVAVRDDLPFVMPTQDALRAVAVNDAILKSVQTGHRETVADWRTD